MILETLIGAIGGGALRLAPEVLKFLDRKGDRQHELALGQQQFELVKLQGNTALQTQTVAADAGQIIAGVNAVQEAYKSMKTGFKLADSISALVRPWITGVLFHAWLAVKIATYVQVTHAGLSWDVALQTLWTGDDVAMLAGVTNFWFLSRVFEKRG